MNYITEGQKDYRGVHPNQCPKSTICEGSWYDIDIYFILTVIFYSLRLKLVESYSMGWMDQAFISGALVTFIIEVVEFRHSGSGKICVEV